MRATDASKRRARASTTSSTAAGTPPRWMRSASRSRRSRPSSTRAGRSARSAAETGLAAPLAAHRRRPAGGDDGAAPPGARRGEDHLRHGRDGRPERRDVEPLFSMHGAYPLVLWQRDGERTYCLEGTAITAGAAILWLRDGLGIIADAGGVAAPRRRRCRTAAACGPCRRSRGSARRTSIPARAPSSAGSRARRHAPTSCARCSRGSRGAVARCTTRCSADSPHPAPTVAARRRRRRPQRRPAAGPGRRPRATGRAPRRCSTPRRSARPTWRGSRPASGATTDDLRHVWRRERVFEPRSDDAERAARLERWRGHVAAARAPEAA